MAWHCWSWHRVANAKGLSHLDADCRYVLGICLRGWPMAIQQAFDGSSPHGLQRRRPSLRPTKQPLRAPSTMLVRMSLKEAPGMWRRAWVEVRPDGSILVFPEASGGVGAPIESLHVERLVDFMPVLDRFCFVSKDASNH